MGTKSKRLFAPRKTERGNYAPKLIVHNIITLSYYQSILYELLLKGKFTEHHLLKQVYKYLLLCEKEKIKAFLSQKSQFEPWMLVLDNEAENSDSFSLLNSFLSIISKRVYGILFFFASLIIIPFTSKEANAQTIPVTGRVIDGITSAPCAGCSVSVFTSIDGEDKRIERGETNSSGRFKVMASILDVEPVNNLLPADYNLSAVYPNPTSGISSVEFTLPEQQSINIKVYDVLGRECLSNIYQASAGSWSADIDMSKFASGMYIVSMFSKGKFIGSRKMMLEKSASGKQFFSASLKKVNEPKTLLSAKPNYVRYIDSIKVTGANYKSSILHNVGYLQGDSVDVGSVAMYSGTVTIDVLVYDHVFWREKFSHPIAGAVVRFGNDSVVTDVNGRGSFTFYGTNVPVDVCITHPSIRTRETKVLVDRDKFLDFDVLRFDTFPDSIYNFVLINFGAGAGQNPPNPPFMNTRWLVRPDFVFKVDTSLASPNPQIQSWSQLVDFNVGKLDSFLVPFSENPIDPQGLLNGYRWKVDKDDPAWSWNLPLNDTSNYFVPGKYCVAWDDSVNLKYGILAGTGNGVDFDSFVLYFASTVYDSYKYWPNVPSVWRNIDRITVHELDTGVYRTGRYDSIQSVTNRGPPYEFRNYTENDRLIRPYLLARPPKSTVPDKDDGWFRFLESNFYENFKPTNLLMVYSFTMADGRTIRYEEHIGNPESFKGLTDEKIREIIRKAR